MFRQVTTHAAGGAPPGGSVTNNAGGTIVGGSGIVLNNGGRVVNAGTIIGTIGDAVDFAKTSPANQLVVDPGAVFIGKVVGGTGFIELASATSAGTLSGFDGTSITNFSTLEFDAGAKWTVSGNATGLGGGALSSIMGFTANDTIDVTGFAAATSAVSTNQLVLTGGDGTSVTLDIQGITASNLQVSSDGVNTSITEACFVAGTHIATPSGEVPVENLTIGDLVLTQRGETKPIVWIGRGRVLATGSQRNAAAPVVVRQGALADNVPHRDLHVTKGHSLYLDGVLIPAEFLVNHHSIVWDNRAQEVEIYHIELASHDVLLADGAPAESYRDDGNRWLFQNANTGWNLTAKPPCAPVLTGGPLVDAIWRRLLDRAGSATQQPTTTQPDLHLLVDDQRLDGQPLRDGVLAFRLPKQPRTVRIVSRAFAPDVLGLARDPRKLGVALRQITLWHGRHLAVIPADDARLDAGFHAFETENGFRWMDGDALLPASLFAAFGAGCELTLHIACTTQYPLAAEPDRIAA